MKLDRNRGIVILSGGLDSTVVLAMAAAGRIVVKGQRVVPVQTVSFMYGQRHSKELICAQTIAEYYDVPHRVAILPMFGESALTDREASLVQSLADYQQKVPTTWHPHRNLVMIALTAQLGASMDCGVILGGWHQDDSAYPDCRQAFLCRAEEVINLSLAAGMQGPRQRIVAPLIYNSKAEIVRRGAEIDAPYHLTWSCYAGGEVHCGVCGTCKQRKLAFAHNALVDQVEYADSTVYND